jgi:hypothetical protein
MRAERADTGDETSVSPGRAQAAGAGAAEAADAVKDGAREAADSEAMSWVARAGVAAHGVVYLLLGLVGLLVALGAENQRVDQRGVFNELASRSWGWVLLLLLALGCGAYALWLFSQAAFGAVDEGDKKIPRVKSALGGAGYALLTVSAVTVLLGSRSSQGDSQQALSARVMSLPGGVVLVALAGLIVLGLGGFMVRQGLTAEFMKHFRPMPRLLGGTVRQLGRIGSIGRGVVVGLAGLLLLSAAWTFDPEKARGLDLAFRATLQEPYGRPLAVAAAAALLAFGLYGLAEAVYRRV